MLGRLIDYVKRALGLFSLEKHRGKRASWMFLYRGPPVWLPHFKLLPHLVGFWENYETNTIREP